MRNYQESGTTFVKLGTGAVVQNGDVDQDFLANVAGQVAAVKCEGKRIGITSSGAVTLGRSRLGEEADLDQAFEIGQQLLTEAWGAALGRHGLSIVEHLISERDIRTDSDAVLDAIQRSLADVPLLNGHNAKNQGVANIAVTGDNDTLNAWVASAQGASGLFITTPPGVLDQRGRVIREIRTRRELPAFTYKSTNGTGGMPSKTRAAFQVAESGGQSVIVGKTQPHVIFDFVEGFNGFGTRFAPQRMLYSNR